MDRPHDHQYSFIMVKTSMPIAAIIDIIKSRKMRNSRRKYILDKIYKIIREMEEPERNNINSFLLAKPAITGGDSLEILAKNSKPILYILHRLLIHDIPTRLGIGTGKIYIIRESSDECDGPAFWAARQAIDEGRRKKTIVLVHAHDTSKRWEYFEAKFTASAFLFLNKMTPEQRKYCFHYIWKNMRIKEIAEKEKVSVSNISQIFKKASCRSLKHLITS